MAQPPLWPKFVLKLCPPAVCIHPPVLVEAWLLLPCPRSATDCILSHDISYKVIYRWLLLVLGLEVSRWGQAVYQGQLVLEPGLGQFRKRYRAQWGQMLLIWENLGKSEAWAKQAIHMGKPLETACMGPKVGWGRASEIHQGGANSVSQVGGVSLITLASWLCHSVRRGLRKEQWPLTALMSGKSCPPVLALMPNYSVSPHMSLMPMNLLPLCWNSEGMRLNKFVCRLFKRNCQGV